MSNKGKIVLDMVSVVIFVAIGVWFVVRGSWVLAVLFSLPAAARCVWDATQIFRRLRQGQDKPPA